MHAIYHHYYVYVLVVIHGYGPELFYFYESLAPIERKDSYSYYETLKHRVQQLEQNTAVAT